MDKEDLKRCAVEVLEKDRSLSLRRQYLGGRPVLVVEYATDIKVQNTYRNDGELRVTVLLDGAMDFTGAKSFIDIVTVTTSEISYKLGRVFKIAECLNEKVFVDTVLSSDFVAEVTYMYKLDFANSGFVRYTNEVSDADIITDLLTRG